ncbi:MAG TPA: DUF3418 domain-containing protein, partial [Pontiella sp.]
MDLLGLPPIDRFPLIDPPQAALINEGYRTLYDIGAITEDRALTPVGRKIAAFPVDPHLARMIVQAHDEGVLPEILVMTAFLSIQDVRERPAEKVDAADLAHRQWMDPRSDFMTILNLWNAVEAEQGEGGSHGRLRRFCKKNFLNYRRVMEWRNLWMDLRETVRDFKWNPGPAGKTDVNTHYDAIHRSLLAGLPASIGLKGEEMEFTAARGRKFFIFPGSALFKKPPQWVMAFTLVETTRLYARTVAEIDPDWLNTIAPHLCKAVYKQPRWNAEKGFVYAAESIISGGLTLSSGRSVHYGPINPEEARKIFIREGMVPANLTTRSGWLKLHRNMLDEIQGLEEKIRRPGALLDADAIYDHFDRLLPAEVCSVKTLEQWLRQSKARIAMRMEDAIYPRTEPIRREDYPDVLTFHEATFPLIYTFSPGEELDGIALVCPTDKLAFLPDWAPEWLVPGWLEEKANRLLRTLPKNLKAAIAPIDQTAGQFRTSIQSIDGPLLDALAEFLQRVFNLPVDASDFDETALPDFLRMKVIETRGDEIVQIHTALSEEHRIDAHRNSTERVFAKWTLPPQQTWPGDALPDFITTNDSMKTRGYPALTDEIQGVGRRVFISETEAQYAHRSGLVRLFRIQQGDQVKYVEKRPPLTPAMQLTLSTIDSEFLTDLINTAIHEALTRNSGYEIRDGAVFAERAAEARTTLYETLEKQARTLEGILNQRESVLDALKTLQADAETRHDLEMQLEFLFRPGFLQIRDVFTRYPRYLKAMQIRMQRIRSNPQADARKQEEIIPFLNRLTERLLQSGCIAEEQDLIEFAMMIEEFRVNRFAPEIKTPGRISARRLEEAWQELQ